MQYLNDLENIVKTPKPTPTPTTVPTTGPSGFFLKGINLGGFRVTIEGNDWISFSEALDNGFYTPKPYSFKGSSISWSPVTDNDTTIMLNNTMYKPDVSLIMTQTIDNGNYDLYFWIGETISDNSRSINIKLEGNIVAAGIGKLLYSTWCKYGPYNVTVSDGALDIEFIPDDPDAHCAGLAIFSK